MRKYFIYSIMIILFAFLTGCNNTEEGINSGQSNRGAESIKCAEISDVEVAANAQKFLYSNVCSTYKDGDPGVKTDSFKNIKESDASTKEKAIELAKNEVTVEYNNIAVKFDDNENIWSICFYKTNTLGGNQTVYLNTDGITVRIVNGE